MTSPFVDRVEYQVIGRDTNASRVFRDVADAADDAGDSVDGLGGHIDRLNQNIDATAVRMRALIAAMRGISDVDLPAIGGLDTAELERANQQLAAMVVEVDRAGQATVRLGDDLDNTSGSIRAIATTTGTAAASITTLGAGLDTLRGTVDDSRTSITGISTDFQNLGQSIEDGRVVVIRFRDDLVSSVSEGRNQVDNLGTGFRNLSTDVETSRGRLGELFADIARAGTIDIAHRIDVGKQIVETVSSNRDRLERAGLVAGATVAGTFLVGLNNLLSGGFAKIPIVGPMVSAVITGLAAVSAPLAAAVGLLISTVAVAAAVTLTAAIGAGILAALGGGAILAGILIQLRDPKVKAAASDLGNLIIQQFGQATHAFAPAIESALKKVGAAVEKMEPQLQDFFEAAAGYVAPLTDAILGFLQSALPGATRAMQAMKPVFDELVKWAPKLGKTVGDFFERLGKNSDGLASGLGYILGATNEAIKFFGILIEEAAKAMGWIEDLWHALATLWNVLDMGNAVGDVFRGIRETAGDVIEFFAGQKVKAAGKNIEEGFKPLAAAKGYVAGLKTETEKLAEATQAAMRAANDFLGLGDSQVAMYKSMRDATEYLAKATGKDLKAGIDLSTEAGSKNWQVLANIASNANRAAQQVLDMKGSTADAAAVMGVARKRFIEVATSMNMSAAEAEILANKMFGIPDVDPKVTLDDKASKGIGDVNGKLNSLDKKNAMPSVGLLDNASRGIGHIQSLLYRLDGNSATVHVNVQADRVPSGLQYAASGGPVSGPGLKGIDSRLYMLAPGEHVLTAAEVDAAGGHHAVEAFRRSLLNKGTANPALPTEAVRGGGSSHVDGRALGEALRRALSGMTLTIDDRTGRTAQLIARGG